MYVPTARYAPAMLWASALCRSACSVSDRGETSVGLSSPGQPTAGNPVFRRTFYIGINDPGTFTISKLPVAMIVSNKFFFSDNGLSIMVIIVNIVTKITFNFAIY